MNKNDRNEKSKYRMTDFGIFKSILKNVNDLGLDPEAFKKGVADGIKFSSKFKALEEKERDARTAYENGLRAGMAIVDGINKESDSKSTENKLCDVGTSFATELINDISAEIEKAPEYSTTPDRLDKLCEKLGSPGILDFSKVDVTGALKGMYNAMKDISVKYNGMDPEVFDKDDAVFAGSEEQMTKFKEEEKRDVPKIPVDKPRLEPIVQDRVARNGLPYKVSYGVSLATCGNTLPRASVVVEPKCFDMKPMCMCVQEITAHLGANPDRYIHDDDKPNECHDRLDVVFTVNTNGVDLMHDLTIDEVLGTSNFTVAFARFTAGELLDILKIRGFFDDFYKRAGYMTKCNPGHILNGMTVIPSVWNKGQFVVKMTMPGRFNEVLFTAIAMEYIRLLMVTFASKSLLPKCSKYNYNMPSFVEIFYINLITDVNMVIENIWKLIDLINASRENDTKPENN